MSSIKPIKANSRDKSDVYRLLNMLHVMAGSLANSPSKEFRLARTQSDPLLGDIVTTWTNGIVDIEARTTHWDEESYHEYSLNPASDPERSA